MVLLQILIFSLYLSLSYSDSSSCLLDNPAADCLGFIPPPGFTPSTENTTLTTTPNSCTAPPDRDIAVRPCGPERISSQDCDRAGCCYKEGLCFTPLSEEGVDYKFYQEGRRYKEAYRECRRAGWYKLPCVVNEFDFTRLRAQTCGNVWLGQTLINRYNVVAPKAQFYNRTTGDCNSKVGVSCRLSPDIEHALTLELAPNNSFVLATVNSTEKRPFLCIKEEWKPHVKTYPHHVSSDGRIQIMLCGIIFSGNMANQQPILEWKLHMPNGTITRLKAKNNTEMRQVSAQYYADTVKADKPGKYECIFSFLDQERTETTSISGWAYHYTPINCKVVAQGVEYLSNQSVIELEAEHSSEINITVICSGYPLPMIYWILSVNEEGPVPQLPAKSGEPLAISKFETLASLYEDISYTVNLQPISEITSLPNTTITISKPSFPTSCNFQLYTFTTDNGTSTRSLLEEDSKQDVRDLYEVEKTSFADQSYELDVKCTGYPVPNITAVILTEKEDSKPAEKIEKPLDGNFNWRMNSFASEASVAQDFSQTLILTAESTNNPPVKMVLRLVKTIIKFDMEIPAEELTLGDDTGGVSQSQDDEGVVEPVARKMTTLPCKGASGPDLPDPSAFWEFNGKILDLNSEIGDYINYKNPAESNTDASISISTQSSIVAGEYKCTILIDNTFNDTYNTKLTARLPPTPPGPTRVTEIIGANRVKAASVLPSSYDYLGDVSITGFLFSGDTVLQEISDTETYNETVYGTFTVPEGSGKIQIAFKASNEYGSSELSKKSDPLEIFPDTPRFSVAEIKRNKEKESSSTLATALTLTFNKIPDTDGYEVRVKSTDKEVTTEFITENEIFIEELEPETSYHIDVRGVNKVGGENIYGPNSLTTVFTTAPEELPAPADLKGQPLESDGNKSAVLLTWSPPQVSAEFVDGFKLQIELAELETDSEETNESRRRKRQALQTFKPVYIPFEARAKVIKDLDGGTTYAFILQSYSSDFGESKPATVTVQTLTAGPCPYTKPELYPPRHCPARVSIDRAYLYIKFYFDCYEGEGRDFRGKHSTTHRGECVPWTKEHLSQFSEAGNLPEIGTNYCRNIEGSKKDSNTLHDKPWCYLADGSNDTCSLRPCNNKVDETCYDGNGTTYQGTGYDEHCAPWSEENLRNYPNFPKQILGTKMCRNWEGSNMTHPWCFTVDGDAADCSVPPCGESTVTFKSGDVTTNYTVSDAKDNVCIKLGGAKEVQVGVRHSFRRENCQSEQIFPQVTIPPKIKWTERLWARYLLVEVILVALFLVLWSALLCRKHVIIRQSSTKTTSSSSKKDTDISESTVTGTGRKIGKSRFTPAAQREAISQLGG